MANAYKCTAGPLGTLKILQIIKIINYNIFKVSAVYFPIFSSLPTYPKSLKNRTESGFAI